jgi:hypothetical protein
VTRRRITLVALVVAAAVVAAAIVDAIRRDSLGPIWTVAWVPAVVTGIWCTLPRRRPRG